MQFLGISWNNNSESPSLVIRNKTSSFSLKQPLSIRVLNKRTCVGHFSHPSYQRTKCLSEVEFDNKGQCSACKKIDSTYFLPRTALSSSQIDILKQQPHYNYVNLFGENHLKTGVSAHVRKNTRALEQGALASLTFAESDGYTAREIEDEISRRLSIPQVLRWKTKIELLKISIDPDEALNILKQVFDQITRVMPPEYRLFLKPQFEFSYKFDKYKIDFYNDSNSIIYIDKILPNNIISGEVVGIYGEIIIMRDTSSIGKPNLYALHCAYLSGYDVEIRNISEKMKLVPDLKIYKFKEKESDQLSFLL